MDVLRRKNNGFPDVRKCGVQYHVLRGDFHIHTTRSDGGVHPRERVLEAWEHGYDVIAITDHKDFSAYEDVKPLAEELGLILIRGMETGIFHDIPTNGEHLPAIGFSDTYQPVDEHDWASAPNQETVYYQDQWPKLVQSGAFIIYAHPHMGWRPQLQWGLERGLLHGIELKNQVTAESSDAGRAAWKVEQERGIYWHPVAFDWALKYDLAVFANSDCHKARSGGPPVMTLVLAAEASAAGVLQALWAKRTIAYFDHGLYGKQSLLQAYVDSVVQHGWQTVDKRNFLALRNTGMAPLSLRVATSEPIVLEANESVLVGCSNKMPIPVEWMNLWVSRNQNLRTEFS